MTKFAVVKIGNEFAVSADNVAVIRFQNKQGAAELAAEMMAAEGGPKSDHVDRPDSWGSGKARRRS